MRRWPRWEVSPEPATLLNRRVDPLDFASSSTPTVSAVTVRKAGVPLAFLLAASAASGVHAAGSPPQPTGTLELGSLKSLLPQSAGDAIGDAATGPVKTAQTWFNNPCATGYWRRC